MTRGDHPIFGHPFEDIRAGRSFETGMVPGVARGSARTWGELSSSEDERGVHHAYPANLTVA